MSNFTITRAAELLESFPGVLSVEQRRHLAHAQRLLEAGLRDLENRPATVTRPGRMTHTSPGRLA